MGELRNNNNSVALSGQRSDVQGENQCALLSSAAKEHGGGHVRPGLAAAHIIYSYPEINRTT